MADARLQVVIDAADRTQKAMSSAIGGLERYKGQLRTAGIALSAFGAVGMAGFGLTIKAASNLNESVNAVNVTFGRASKTLLDFGKTAAQSAGLAQADFNQMASTTGAMLQNFGLSADEAARQTIALTKRAADLASVFNTDVNDAMAAIQSGLQGMALPLRRYAVDVTETTLEMEALALGIERSVSEMSQQEKASLRLSAIMRQSGVAAGDFERTNKEFANSLRVISAEMTNLKAKIGTVLLPTIADLLQKLRGVVDYFNNLNPTVLRFATIAGMAAVAFAAIGGPILLFLSFVPSMVAGFSLIGGAAATASGGLVVFAALLGKIAVVIAAAATAALTLGAAFKTLSDLLSGNVTATEKYLDATKESFSAFELFMAHLKDGLDTYKNLAGTLVETVVPSFDFLTEAENLAADAAEKVTQNLNKLLDKADDTAWGRMRAQFEALGIPLKPLLDEYQALLKAGVSVITAQQVAGELARKYLDAQFDIIAASKKGGEEILAAMREAGVGYLEMRKRLEELPLKKVFDDATESIEATIAAMEDLSARTTRAIAPPGRLAEAKAQLAAAEAELAGGGLSFWRENELVILIRNLKNFINQLLNPSSAIGMGKLPPTLPGLPAPSLQRGGVVTRPTLALLGEAGPEAVIPLKGKPAPVFNVTLTLDGRVLTTVLGRLAENDEAVRSS